jgi:AraC-like DNA-binding protein
MTNDEKVILEAYKKAFRAIHSDSEIVDINIKSAIRFDWVILRLSDIIPIIGNITPPFRHPKFTLIYVTKGEGEKTITTFNVAIKSRTLMIVPAQTLSTTIYSNDVTGYHLSFNLDFFLQEQFPRYHLLQLNLFKQTVIPFTYLNSRTGNQLSQIFESILEEKAHHRKNKKELILLKILELILLCDRQLRTVEAPEKEFNQPLMIRYMEMIQEHFKQEHSTSFYAGKLHIHPNSLNASTKRYMGQSAKDVIATKLLNEAKYMLQVPTLSIKEIAYELGFLSPSNFFRFFKRHCGASPADYRNKHLKR